LNVYLVQLTLDDFPVVGVQAWQHHVRQARIMDLFSEKENQLASCPQAAQVEASVADSAVQLKMMPVVGDAVAPCSPDV
jgi:hypothetical protein